MPKMLQDRARRYALRILRLVESLPHTSSAHVTGNQLLRSGTSAGANDRSSCRSRSKSKFIAKVGIRVEEADESLFRLELLAGTNIIPVQWLEDMMNETNEIVSIMPGRDRPVCQAGFLNGEEME